MKLHRFALLGWLAQLLVGWSVHAQPPAYPPHTIANSELRELPRNSAGRHYQLSIGLPPSYKSEPTRRYPAVFVTDGYWDFQKIDAVRNQLLFDRVVPEFIIVGLGYAGENLDYPRLRGWELLPVQLRGDADTGHASEFLKAIEAEIIPFVEREYRIDSAQRVLAGASAGGLFTLYTMYSKPALFQAYVAATPAVYAGDDWLLGYEEEFVKSGRPINARLHVSMGENEGPSHLAGILRYNARVTSRSLPGLTYEFRIIDGERHAGMQLEAYMRGLRFVFAPLAPERGPSTFPPATLR